MQALNFETEMRPVALAMIKFLQAFLGEMEAVAPTMASGLVKAEETVKAIKERSGRRAA